MNHQCFTEVNEFSSVFSGKTCYTDTDTDTHSHTQLCPSACVFLCKRAEDHKSTTDYVIISVHEKHGMCQKPYYAVVSFIKFEVVFQIPRGSSLQHRQQTFTKQLFNVMWKPDNMSVNLIVSPMCFLWLGQLQSFTVSRVIRRGRYQAPCVFHLHYATYVGFDLKSDWPFVWERRGPQTPWRAAFPYACAYFKSCSFLSIYPFNTIG